MTPRIVFKADVSRKSNSFFSNSGGSFVSIVVSMERPLCCCLNSVFEAVHVLYQMATCKNKKKVAVVSRETQERDPRSRNCLITGEPGMNDECICQVSEKIEVRVINIVSQEFSRTENRILGAFSKIDEFL